MPKKHRPSLEPIKPAPKSPSVHKKPATKAKTSPPTPKTPTPSKSATPNAKNTTSPSLSEVGRDAGGTSKKDISTENTPEIEAVRRIEDVPVSVPVPRMGPDAGKSQIERLLNIKWSKYVPKIPTKKQIAAMMLSHKKELLYGGALGGGKSEWLAMEALRYCDLPGFSAIIFRRQLTDLEQPGSLIPRIADWLSPHVEQGFCKYAGDKHSWSFKCFYPGTDIPGPDARLQFGYIGQAAVRERYQSAEYQLAAFDELGQWPDPVDYLFMRSRLRKTVCPIHKKDDQGNAIFVPGCRFCDVFSVIPLRVRAATNPGPAWIKRRFDIIPDPAQFRSRHEALIAISEGYKVRWIGTNPDRPFIPAYLDDNPHLDAKDYKDMLREMSPDERSRLEDGNWEARRNARFKRQWQKFYHLNVPEELLKPYPCTDQDILIDYPIDIDQCSYALTQLDRSGQTVVHDPIPFSSLNKLFVTIDPAVTVRQGPVDDQLKLKNSFSVLSVWGVTQQNDLLWLNCRKFRKEIPDLVEHAVQINSIWRPKYHKIECNGVGIGVAQFCEAAGLPVVKNYKKNDKLENSLSAQILMKSGRVWFPINAYWLEEAEDDVFSWTGLPTEDDDVVDSLSDAATEVAESVAREVVGVAFTQSRPTAIPSVAGGAGSSLPYYGLNGPGYYRS